MEKKIPCTDRSGSTYHQMYCKGKMSCSDGPYLKAHVVRLMNTCVWGLSSGSAAAGRGHCDPQCPSLPSPLLASISASAVWFDLSSTEIYKKDTMMVSSLTFGIYTSDYIYIFPVGNFFKTKINSALQVNLQLT